MKHHFVKGERVGLLDEDEKGVVVKTENEMVWVQLDNGIEIPVHYQKLVSYDVPVDFIPPVKDAETAGKAKKTTSDWPSPKKKIPKVNDKDFIPHPALIGEEKHKKNKAAKDAYVWEIDLHVEELTDQYKHLTNGEILEIQMTHFRRVFNTARNKRVQKLILIHGVGMGRLKAEISEELMRYPDVEFYDASYKEYGRGATEVKIYYGKG